MTIRVPSATEYGAFLQIRIVRTAVVPTPDFAAGRAKDRFFTLHRKNFSVARSVIKVPSFPSHDGDRRSGLSAVPPFEPDARKSAYQRVKSDLGLDSAQVKRWSEFFAPSKDQ